MFTRAFYDEHRDLVVYAASNVDLAPGFDARGDLAPAIGALGHELQSARDQEQKAIDDALRPLVIVLVALGVLAFGGTAVAAGQVIQRTRDRWLADDARLQSLGMASRQIRAIELASSALIAVLAVAVALITMVLASPIAPVGPLHDLDPTQGFAIDATVAVLGTVAIIATIAVLTLVFSSVRHRLVRPMLRRSRWLATMPGGPATAAGLTLALRTDDGHDRALACGRGDDRGGRGPGHVRRIRHLRDHRDRHSRRATASTPTSSPSTRTATSRRPRSSEPSATAPTSSPRPGTSRAPT